MADLVIDGNRVSSRNPAVQLDLGGYAKGYALDRAATILRANGVANALINIGGNVMALGRKNGTPWRVGIQHPRKAGALATIELADGEALGTSSSSCAAGVSSLQSNRCRMTTRTWRHIWHGSSNTAARPMRRSGATGPISGGSCLCSATLHNGMQPSSGVRFNNEARRRRVLHHCSSR